MSKGKNDVAFLFKVIVVGDAATGKTAVTMRWATGTFSESYRMTIGVDFAVKIVEADGKKVKLSVWDTAGQERFSHIRPMYFRGARGSIIVYDVTNKKSFENVGHWLEEVKKHCDRIPLLLVGNKVDLEVQREVTTREGEGLAEKLGIPFFETSAKTGEVVTKCFTMLAKEMVEEAEKGQG
ncbi:MAG: GTP-binding protein [Candidatus Wukongarchaeota archaeon]|nr:GTP-binding protein [Candidatus Wukongarchaeota archaeon]